MIKSLFKEHPRGLPILFFAEMWERFSFYGMRSLVVLYMINSLKYSEPKAYATYGAYASLLYASSIIGGILADRVLGNRKAIIVGGYIIALGHILLSIPFFNGFYLGLGALICGTGLFKANISTLLGQLYPEGDERRDSGFTLFYMGINIGAVLSSLTCAYVADKYGWHYGFGLAAIGMLFGIFTFLKWQDYLSDHGFPPVDNNLNKQIIFKLSLEKIIYVSFLCAIPIFAFSITQYEVFDVLIPVLGIVVISYLIYFAFKSSKYERWSILTIVMLMFFHTSFWGLFEQAATSLSVFTERHIDRQLFNFVIKPGQFQALNPAFIIMLAPLFSWLWTYLGRKNINPYPPMKFVIALVLVGLGFGALYCGGLQADSQGFINVGWLILAYFLHTLGELCISPIGLSMVTRLSPMRIVSMMMGVWFLTISFGNYMAGVFARLAAFTGSITDENAAQESLAGYLNSFKTITIFALVMAGILLILVPFFRKVFEHHNRKAKE